MLTIDPYLENLCNCQRHNDTGTLKCPYATMVLGDYNHLILPISSRHNNVARSQYFSISQFHNIFMHIKYIPPKETKKSKLI
ncbi:hypothetical protein Pint_13922 [Pistacia integerrima]|uniref:Uncharacterized protein n=1 Tax=Pistacia integerrima TaxID=434235 RepID=A0ACC0Y7A8_9ROSI|nr:hypothetical protein Pint_13922 [Pistacia integerrima]